MSGHRLLSHAALLLLAFPTHAAASEAVAGWSSEVGELAVLGVIVAFAWHRLAGHTDDIGDRWRHVRLADRWHRFHVADQLRHTLVYARAHTHRRH